MTGSDATAAGGKKRYCQNMINDDGSHVDTNERMGNARCVAYFRWSGVVSIDLVSPSWSLNVRATSWKQWKEPSPWRWVFPSPVRVSLVCGR